MDLVHDNSSPAPTPTANRAIRLQLENYASYAYIRVNFPRTEKIAKNLPFVEARGFKVNCYHWFNLLRLLNFSNQILSLGLKRCFRWRIFFISEEYHVCCQNILFLWGKNITYAVKIYHFLGEKWVRLWVEFLGYHFSELRVWIGTVQRRYQTLAQSFEVFVSAGQEWFYMFFKITIFDKSIMAG